MSLTSLLPKPSLTTSKWADSDDDEPVKVSQKQTKRSIPKYGHRQNFVPTLPEHFGDGGSYPEIHIVQYPLGMGKKISNNNNNDTIPLQVDRDGKVRYDLVLHQGEKHNDSKIIHHTLNDMTEQDVVDLERPDEETLNETTEKTRMALEKIIDKRIQSGKTGDVSASARKDASFVRYKGAEGDGKTRVIKVVEAPRDPLEPPKFKHRKLPRGPGSPPPPVLQSPPRKISAQEQANWNIPPCISNWKNAKGYTIPLDKRLANDGRGLQDVSINDNFAKLSEALFIADRHAREEVKLRAEMQKKLAQNEKREKEEKLRMLAQKAREERALNASSSEDESSVDEEQVREREILRKEKQKQREKEVRHGHKDKKPIAYNIIKIRRDISEKIALGVAQPTISKESMYDQRLFNQTSGLSSGFGSEDAYNLYDKSLFNGSTANMIYRPKRVDSEITSGVESEKIDKLLQNAPTRGFQGTDSTSAIRNGPVQFEKEDVFGVDAFMNAAKRGRDNEKDDRPTKK